MTSSTSVTDETAEAQAADPDSEQPTEAEEPGKNKRSAGLTIAVRARRMGDSSISLTRLLTGVVIAACVIACAVLGWRMHSKSNEIDGLHRQAADSAHAESVALDYATGAADMDFHNLASWRGKLTKGTTPELSNRLTQASNSMEQIITPLQWTATAKPIAAKVRSESGGLYTVDCFVNVMTKNQQAPDGITSTATYKLTIDSNHNWVITDISGIDSALATK